MIAPSKVIACLALVPAAARSFSFYGASKADQVHLVNEGTLIYGAPRTRLREVGSKKSLEGLAELPSLQVRVHGMKGEKLECPNCATKFSVPVESGADALSNF